MVYTDVARDGMFATGPDIAGAIRLAGLGASVIASGGVSALDSICAAAKSAGLAGAIEWGVRCYDGRFDVTEALRVARGEG